MATRINFSDLVIIKSPQTGKVLGRFAPFGYVIKNPDGSEFATHSDPTGLEEWRFFVRAMMTVHQIDIERERTPMSIREKFTRPKVQPEKYGCEIRFKRDPNRPPKKKKKKKKLSQYNEIGKGWPDGHGIPRK